MFFFFFRVKVTYRSDFALTLKVVAVFFSRGGRCGTQASGDSFFRRQRVRRNCLDFVKIYTPRRAAGDAVRKRLATRFFVGSAFACRAMMSITSIGIFGGAFTI